jgi:catechol 2,3-dioxygenase-like lactoylglutathione lyase family enzyme
MAVTQLDRISVTVADLVGTAAFYRDWLGLAVGPERQIGDPAWIALLGLEAGIRARAVDVAIGQRVVELVGFDPPGRPYPSERASND